MNLTFPLLLVAVVMLLYWLNSWSNGRLVDMAQTVPKLLALAVALLAIFFPRDISFIPDILYKHNLEKLKGIGTGNSNSRSVTPSMKKWVAAAQEWRCRICDSLLSASYEVDHIIPIYKGGSNVRDNLQALCRNCHGQKTMHDTFI